MRKAKLKIHELRNGTWRGIIRDENGRELHYTQGYANMEDLLEGFTKEVTKLIGDLEPALQTRSLPPGQAREWYDVFYELMEEENDDCSVDAFFDNLKSVLKSLKEGLQDDDPEIILWKK